MSVIKKFFKIDNLLRALIKNASMLLSANVLSQLLGLLTLVLTTRLLGAELFGILVVIQTYSLVIDKLLNFQSWQALIKYGIEALETNNSEKFKGYIKFGSLLDFITAVFAMLLGVICIQFIGPIINLDSNEIVMASFYCITILFHLSGTPTAILRIFDKFHLLAYQQVISSIIKLLGIIIAILYKGDHWFVLGTWIITDIVGNLVLLYFGHSTLVKKKIRKWWLSKLDNWKDIFKFTWYTNLTSVFDIPVKQLDVMIISSLISFEAVSVYKVFKQVASILSRVADPIYQAIYPQLVQLISNNKVRESIKYSLKSGLIISLILFPIILIMIVSSPLWLKYFFGTTFSKYWHVLALYLVLRLLSVTFICIHPLFIAMGFVRKNVVILLVTNIFYLVIAIVLGKSIGLIGIVIAYGIQFMSVIIWKLIYVGRKNDFVFKGVS